MRVSHRAVDGVRACDQFTELPRAFWENTDEAWRLAQRRDGGWPHHPGDTAADPDATAGGVLTLLTVRHFLDRDKPAADCRGNVEDAELEAGLRWIDKHVADYLDDPHLLWLLSEVGQASGRKRFGGVDWYQAGMEWVAKRRNPDGSIARAGEAKPPADRADAVEQTAYALLFLASGRRPLLMNKLEHDTLVAGRAAPADWDQRPGDIAGFAPWVGRWLCTYPMAWQIVSLKAHPEDLYDAPVLYVSGSGPVAFNNNEEALLRQYVEDGGLVLGCADCGSPAFAASFQALGQKLFPKYAFRRIPPDHILFTEEMFKATKWKNKPAVLGLSNGVRELMILIPEADPGRAWQKGEDRTRDGLFAPRRTIRTADERPALRGRQGRQLDLPRRTPRRPVAVRVLRPRGRRAGRRRTPQHHRRPNHGRRQPRPRARRVAPARADHARRRPRRPGRHPGPPRARLAQGVHRRPPHRHGQADFGRRPARS